MSGWTIHPLQRGLGTHLAEWAELNQRSFGNHPLLDATLVDTLLKHFGSGREVLCVRRQGTLPDAMCILRPGRLGLWQSFVPSQAQVSPTMIERIGDLQPLLRRLPGHATRLDLMCLDPLLCRLESPRHKLIECTSHALTMAIDLAPGFDRWWQSRTKKLRSNLGRYERRVVEDGLAPRLVQVERPEDIGAALSRYSSLEREGWKGAHGTAVDEASGQLGFYTDLLTACAADGRARVYELWFGDELVASRLMLTTPSAVVALKTAYNERFKRHAPGRLLMLEMIRDVFARCPDRPLEFYTNASVDQLAWASSHRHIVHASIYRGRLARLAHETGRRMMGGRAAAQAAAEGGAPQVEFVEGLIDCPADIDALLTKAECDRVSFGADWFRNFAGTVCRGRDVRFAALRSGDRLHALVPLVRNDVDERQFEGLGNYYTTLYSPAVEPGSGPTVLAPVLQRLLGEPGGLTTLRFAPMDPLSPTYSVLRASLLSAGFATFEFFCHGNWYLPVQQDWTSYLASREGKLRNTIHRMERRLRAVRATIEIVQSADDAERGIAAFLHVYSRSWKRPEPFADFVPGLIRLCAARGWLRLGIVSIDGVAVAVQLWIVANGRAEIYKLAHDEAHRALAPGTVLTAHLMRHVIEVDHVREVDYLIGDEPYKAQWMTHRRERWGLVAHNLRSPSGMARCAKEILAQVTHPLRRLRRGAVSPEA